MFNTKPVPNKLLLEALRDRWKKYRLELTRCRREFSNESVHDLRVALRRLLSLFQLLNFISPRPRLRKLIRTFKNQLDEFDDLRDTQVMLSEISGNIHDFPQLVSLQGHLEKAQTRLLKKLRKKIRNLDLKKATRRTRKTREMLKDGLKDDLVAPILQSVDDAYMTTWQRHERVDPAQPATIHRVRVAFKKFRYMVEIIHPLLDRFPEENIKLMNRYQTLMGEIQDAEVFMRTLADFQASGSTPELEAVHLHHKSRHADAISIYFKNRDVINEFWRTSPEEPFPWEKEKNE